MVQYRAVPLGGSRDVSSSCGQARHFPNFNLATHARAVAAPTLTGGRGQSDRGRQRGRGILDFVTVVANYTVHTSEC